MSIVRIHRIMLFLEICYSLTGDLQSYCVTNEPRAPIRIALYAISTYECARDCVFVCALL